MPDLIEIAFELRTRVARLRFDAPVTHVYNPLVYAWRPHREYLRRFGKGTREVVLLGMNPGPWGMAQTGVPFGDVTLVRDWIGIEAPVRQPARPHPRRPVLGFGCTRGEVSGRRLWGWARAAFGTPERFFARFFILNYCPLAFFEESGRNLTPDRLARDARERLFKPCDIALAQTIERLRPRYVLGIGRFAAERARTLFAGSDIELGVVPHPSPANPGAHRGWARQLQQVLRAHGIPVR